MLPGPGISSTFRVFHDSQKDNLHEISIGSRQSFILPQGQIYIHPGNTFEYISFIVPLMLRNTIVISERSWN